MANKAADVEFQQVFDALRKLITKHAKKLVVQADTPSNYSLYTKVLAPNKKPMFFAGVSVRKNSVNYYLMPVYTCPDLLNDVAPELKARMQGKSCFNFKKLDKALFAQLGRLTDAGYAQFKDDGWI